MRLNLVVWRQENAQAQGEFVEYPLDHLSPNMSFLEMLDLLNETLTGQKKRPVEFDSDCREGICGTCGLVINGQAHGPKLGVATCQLYLRDFQDGATIVVEPWRAKAFPVTKDLCVNRGAYDRIIEAGGFISAKTGPHPDGNAMLVGKPIADQAFDAATCIGCGACAAACPNASASLFTAAKILHLGLLPQGQPERLQRVKKMVEQMDLEGFGNCSNIGECQAACPKGISIDSIAFMKRDYAKACVTDTEGRMESGG
jgi:succinate dehydrogenase / fumarate reductase iron-sulfur subunit